MSTRRNNLTTGDRLTARSVLLSVLLGTDPPRLGVRVLVRTTELFGIAEGTTRTALSRMVAAGELSVSDGTYELTGPNLLARQARQSASRAGLTTEWEGDWLQAIVGSSGRRTADDRATLRSSLASLRFAELREGVWLRPANLRVDPAGDGTDARPDLPGDDQVQWFTVRPNGDSPGLARRLWDLGAWRTEALALRESMALLTGPLEHGDRSVLADGFVVSAAVLRHFQSDPLLPAQLLPQDWPGPELRTEYDRYDSAYRDVLRRWFSEQGLASRS